MEIIINAEGAVLGRVASYAAKQALEGKEVVILNSEKTIISGNKKDVIKRYSRLKRLGGTARKGPNYSRIPYLLLKRAIRGMLPDYRRGIGKQAFSRIRCYNDIPKEFEKEKIVKFPAKEYKDYIKLGELSERI